MHKRDRRIQWTLPALLWIWYIIGHEQLQTKGYDLSRQIYFALTIKAQISAAKTDPRETILLLSSEKSKIKRSANQQIPIDKRKGSVKITKYDLNQIHLKSSSNSDGYLLLSESYYPGWHAYIDNVEVPILKADFLLRAIPLPAGEHKISFIYRPNSFILGASISVITIILLTIGTGFLFFKEKQPVA